MHKKILVNTQAKDTNKVRHIQSNRIINKAIKAMKMTY